MSLSNDLYNALETAMTSSGNDLLPEQATALENVSKDIAKSISDFIQNQVFEVTKFKAPVSLDSVSSVGPLSLMVGTAPITGVPNAGGPVVIPPLLPVVFNPLQLSKLGGQSGVLNGTGTTTISMSAESPETEASEVKLTTIKKGSL